MLLAFLAIAVALVAVYVLTDNTITERRTKVAQLQQQVSQQQAEATRLTNYAPVRQAGPEADPDCPPDRLNAV